MNKRLRIACIALTFELSGFYLYKTTTGVQIIDVIFACLWFICGILNCMTLYENGKSDGMARIFEIVNDVVKKESEKLEKKIKELEESEGEDES